MNRKHNPYRRVVVTGMGVISSVGTSIDEFMNNLLSGVSGVGSITRFDLSNFDVKIAAEVKNFAPEDYGIEKKQVKRVDLFALYALAGAQQAIIDAGITKRDSEITGVIIGTGVGGFGTTEEEHAKIVKEKPDTVSPFTVPKIMPNSACGAIAIKYGLKGPSYSVSSACSSGVDAIISAYNEIFLGNADIMVTGGAEAAITPLSLSGFSNAKALSTRNEEPEKASRPFDLYRDGFVMGEGAGILVLEEYLHAKLRDAKIYAEILGYCQTNDAHHITAPSKNGEGAINAMKNALKNAKLIPAEIEYINSHGTSTPLNDRIETYAIKQVFGDYACMIPINSTKSMIGHALGAAGAIESIVAVLTLNRGIIHPTINLETPDPVCDLNYTPNVSVQKTVRTAMKNSFGFGGHNSVLIFRKHE
ncbi:MAG TPA: beta-ketoacyl-ACP synthase II [Candidatus Nanoarchaeia archaeon]|nr:beta-ketoacyl-ACP synthase II [Candidatus Nanoarchaeia archaeon]